MSLRLIKLFSLLLVLVFSYLFITTDVSVTEVFAQSTRTPPPSDPYAIEGCFGASGSCDCSSPKIRSAINTCGGNMGVEGGNQSSGRVGFTAPTNFTGECEIRINPRGKCTISGPSTVTQGGGYYFPFTQNLDGCSGNSCGDYSCSVRFNVVAATQPPTPTPPPTPPPRYSISGQLFFDTNRNGIPDSTDDRVCKGTVYLQNQSGSTVAQYEVGPTAPNQYIFSDIIYANYKLLVPTPTGYQATTPSFYDFLLNGNRTYNFGVARATPTTLTGRVFVDQNKDGVFNGSDRGLWLERVQLLSNSTGAVTADVQTDGSGYYTISFISPGGYTVHHTREPLWTNWIRTTPNNVVVDMTTDQTVSFGVADNTPPPPPPPPPVTLSGKVFIDDGSNTGIWLERVQILNNSTGQVVASAQTDGNGNYLITNVAQGTYTVRHEREPLWAGWIRTTPRDVAVNMNTDRVVNYGMKDNSPPPPPSILPITAKWCSGPTPQTRIQWNATARTTSYTVLRIYASGQEVTLGAVNEGSPLEWTDTPPENNQYYWYTVVANGPGGSTRSVNTYAGASGNCVAPAISSSASQCTPYGIRLTWSTTTPNLTSFQVDRMVNGNSATWTTIASDIKPNDREYTDSTVTPMNTYTYVIRSYGAEGQASPNSTTSSDVQAQYCDFTPPTLTWNPLSLNNSDPNGCFDDVMVWPRAIEANIIDNPPPSTPSPSGVNPSTVQIMLQNTTTGQISINWTNMTQISNTTWRYPLERVYLARNETFRLTVRATDNAGNTGTLSYNFRFMRSCWDWIQTRQGNVHSEGNINVPGGP